MRYPGAKWRPVRNASGSSSWGGGRMTAHLGLILHVQAGNNSPFGWFCNPASQASSTWWVSKTGRVEQYVDTDMRAWAQGSGNSTYNSVETEGYPGEPLTAAQVRALTQLYAWGHAKLGWPVRLADRAGERGLGWHGMGGSAWGSHPGCPGEIRKGQRAAVLAGLRSPAPKAPAKPTVVKTQEREIDVDETTLRRIIREEVLNAAYREYVDEDGDGRRDARTVSDILYSTHRAAVLARRAAESVAQDMAQLVPPR